MHQFVHGHGRVDVAWSRVSLPSPSKMTWASLIVLRKSSPPHSNISLSFWALSLMPMASANRLVCSYHSSNLSKYLAGSLPKSHCLPAVAKAASITSAILIASVIV